jgi:MtaA/CmuA family methyltransferase
MQPKERAMGAEMNGVERVRRTIAGETPDRAPVVALIIHHAIRLSGVRYDEYACNPRLLVDTQVRAWQEYGYDGFHVTCDNWVLPSALGCPIKFFPDQPPTAAARVLAGSKDLNLLTRPRTGTEGRMGFKVEATRLAAEAVGDRCYLKTCFDSGPFSLATAVRGIENLMLDCTDDPQFVYDLLEICTDAVVKFARACGQAGCHALTFGDSTAGLLSRDLYKRFAYPYAKRVIDALVDLEIPVFMHICGDTGHIIDLMAAAGATGLEVDYQHDIAFYKRETGGAVCLQGNIAPAAIMYRGTPQDVENASRIALEQGMVGGRHILSAGCEIPRDTPGANIHALVNTAKQFGQCRSDASTHLT